MRVVGLDLSLTASGFAQLDLAPELRPWGLTTIELHTVGEKGSNTDSLDQRFTRLRRTAGQILALTLADSPALVAVEQPAFGSGSGHVSDRAGLWWLVIGRLMALGVPVVEVPISARCTYATGKGRTDKDAIVAAVSRRYESVPLAWLNNNTADALILAAMCARALGRPLEPTLPKANLAAMAKITWPATVGWPT
jgi:crossover junction endodeoxyribonuclease RuvC